jgi:MFS family permease
MNRNRHPQIFYGWWIVLVCFIEMTIVVGNLYVFSVFLAPLTKSFPHWSRVQLSLGYSIQIMSFGLVSPFVGRLIDRIGPKKVMMIGAFGSAVSYFLLGTVNSLPSFYILYALSGISADALGYLPVVALLSSWFVRRRGIAIGIAMAGVAFGGFVLANILTATVAAYGWRIAYEVVGAVIFAVVPLMVGLVIANKPTDMGLSPDGAPMHLAVVATGDKGNGLADGLSFSATMRTTAFWLISIGAALAGLPLIGLAAHLVPMLTAAHYSLKLAGLLLGCTIGASALGRVAGGGISDKFNKQHVLVGSVMIQTLGIVALLAVGNSPVFLVLYVVLFGAGFGGAEAVFSVVLAEFFGVRSLGQVYGALTLMGTVGAFIGPVLAARVYDVTNSYYWAVVAFGILSALAATMIALASKPKTFTVTDRGAIKGPSRLVTERN